MGLLREEMVCVLGGWREGCSTVNYSSKEKQSCQMLLMGLHCQSLINGKTILLMGNWAAYKETERERVSEREREREREGEREREREREREWGGEQLQHCQSLIKEKNNLAKCW